MELNDYLKIIIKGLAEDSKNLKQYFIRNQKIYERDNFVKAEEFYSKLNIVISDLRTRCKKRYYESKKELHLVLELKEAKNENTKKIVKEINEIKPSQFPLNLLHLTNGDFRGFINYSDIEYFESVIVEILNEEINLESTKPQQTESDKTDEVKRNEYINIFKNDLGYTLFFELHNIYKIKKNTLANYSFLFYALQKDYLVCRGFDFVKFLSKLNIHIDKIDSRQSGTNNRTNLFNSIQYRFLPKQ